MADLQINQQRPPASRLCTGRTLLFEGGFGTPEDLFDVSIVITFAGLPVTIFNATVDGFTCVETPDTITCTRGFLPANSFVEFLVRFEADAPGALTVTAVFAGTNAAGQSVGGAVASLLQIFRCPRRVPEPPLLVCDGFLPCCVCRRPFVPRTC